LKNAGENLIIGPSEGRAAKPTITTPNIDEETVQANIDDMAASQISLDEFRAAYARSEYRCIQSVARGLRPGGIQPSTSTTDFGDLLTAWNPCIDPVPSLIL
jgi:hypothetical protein